MKFFKKSIIIGAVFIITVCIVIFKFKTNEKYEEIEPEGPYLINEIKEQIEDKNYIILHITGEVVAPGVVKIEEGARIKDVIDAAGGLTQDADVDKINLAYIVSDGQKIYIPSIYDETDNELITTDIGENIIEENLKNENSKININTATQTELEELKGIGPSTAMEIIKYRKENGNFKRVEDIKNVPGIGENKFKTIENDICI